MRRTLVVGDLHLSAHTPRAVAADFAALLRASAGARVVIAGDFFDLSAETPRVSADRAIETGFGAHGELRRALAEHVDAGGELAWLAGNHDPEMGGRGASERLRGALGLGEETASRLTSSPWFLREGDLHVEHGHLYDPDNAPEHPLVPPRASLGVHFVEDFIAPTGAYSYLNANDDTPLRLLVHAFRAYGPRGPEVVARYFMTAARALARSGPRFAGEGEWEAGEAELDAFVAGAGVDAGVARALLDERATPTMRSLHNTIARLYLDRVAGTVTILAGLATLAAGRRRAGAALVGLGAVGLAASWSRGHDRYGGTVAARLEDGALRVGRASGASLVVMGHAHVATQRDGYANTGSFAFPRGAPGRPYLEIEGPPERPRAARRFWSA